MRRRRLGQRSEFLKGVLAVLALGVGAWWGIVRAPLAFAMKGTPTLLVEDEVVQGALPYEQLKAITGG
jgi:hypothetical protein